MVGEGPPKDARRYEEFRDESGSWSFEIREYRDDLNSLSHVSVPPEPGPEKAYRAAVFLEGYIRERKAKSEWSDDTLDRFDVFDSTHEVEAVATALREIENGRER